MVNKSSFLIGFESEMEKRGGVVSSFLKKGPGKTMTALKRAQNIANIKRNKPIQKIKRGLGYGLLGGAGLTYAVSDASMKDKVNREQLVGPGGQYGY